MSYCRWGSDSDLYMYHSVFGKYVLHIKREETVEVVTPEEALAACEKLRAEGVLIPDRTFNRLRTEIKEARRDKTNRTGR